MNGAFCIKKDMKLATGTMILEKVFTEDRNKVIFS